MLINFFFTLRAAKLKVSVKEYLTLLEAIKSGVIDDPEGGSPTVDSFYYLSRAALVKDEAQYDKFDRAFAAYFKGVELLADFTQEIPLEWLQKRLELELSPEEKAKIEKMGWDELMETLKKRFEEQKKRHEGGNRMIGTGGTSPSAPTATTRRASASARRRAATRARSRSGTSASSRTTTTASSSARATSRWRCDGCAVRPRRRRGGARPRRHDPADRGQRRLARHQDGARAAQQGEGPAADGRGRDDGRAHPPRRGAVLGRQDRVQAPRVLLLPQLRLRLHVEEQPAPLQREVQHLGHHQEVQQGLQADLRRRRAR